MRSKAMRKAIVLASASILVGGLVDITPVHARDGFGAMLGGAIIGGAIVGGIMSGMAHGRMPRNSRNGNANQGDQDNQQSKDKNAADDRVLASLGAPSQQHQTAILKTISISGDVGAVGTKNIAQIGVAASSEADRDYTKRIEEIIDVFKAQQTKSSVAGDVTAHAIEQSLDRAFKDSKLETFESFVGENWSAERLRVMILKRLKPELEALFMGNNRGNAPMQELDNLIQRSAKVIYDRLFEISELLAANRSTALFSQRLYQTQGSLVNDWLREDTDRMITTAASTAASPFDSLMRRDPNGVALRYRAERIVLDCLSENVAKITSSETSIATDKEIEHKIGQTAAGQCMAWLENQFGTDKDKLKPQKPMPLRAVWSPTGPRDDPSMYGRVSSAL